MGNARQRLNRKHHRATGESAQRFMDACALNTYWRTNPLMAPAVRTHRTRFTRDPRSAYADVRGHWQRTSARIAPVVRVLWDVPQTGHAETMQALSRKGARQRSALTITRTRVTLKPDALTKRQQRMAGAQDVETWATKKG